QQFMGPNRRTAEICAFWLRIALSGLPELIEFLRIYRDHALADAPRPPGGAIMKSDDDWRAIRMAPDGALAYKNWDHVDVDPRAIDDFPRAMVALIEQHRPSRMPFFRRVSALPFAVASDPDFLAQVHLVYQSAMHATRAAARHDARCEDDGRGARRRVEQPRSDRADRPPQHPPAVAAARSSANKNARARPGHFCFGCRITEPRTASSRLLRCYASDNPTGSGPGWSR